MPLKLYHGTAERIAKETPKKGLKPYTLPHFDFSSEEKDIITLTSVYGGIQAFQASQPSKDERWAIIELNVDRLDEKCLGKNWHKALENKGLCSYSGIIPAAAIAKVWIYTPTSNWTITRAILHASVNRFDAKLSILNRWLTGDFVTLDEWLGEQKNQFSREQREVMSSSWHERSGLDLYYQS
jgi:hypothetical protein